MGVAISRVGREPQGDPEGAGRGVAGVDRDDRTARHPRHQLRHQRPTHSGAAK